MSLFAPHIKPLQLPRPPGRLLAAIQSEVVRSGRGRGHSKGLASWQIGLIIAGVGICIALIAAFATSSMPWGDQSAPSTEPTAPIVGVAPAVTIPGRSPDAALAGAREPSGAVALPGKGVILVVDDEPKRAPHKLGLFVYRPKAGQLQHLPLSWPAHHKRRWDDWEGIASDGRHVVMMTSHSRRKGKRARICRFPITALQIKAHKAILTQRLACVGGKAQRVILKQLLVDGSAPHGYQLTSGWLRKGPKQGGLDIEGLLYDPLKKRFLVGLRGPLVQRGGKAHALVLAMTWGEGDPQFSVVGLMDFGDRGIRAMTRLSDGSILISAGPVGNRGSFRLYRLAKGWPQSPFRLRPRALSLPSGQLRKVEGMAQWKGHLFLFRDDGDWYTTRRARVYALPIKKVMTP